MKRSKPQAPEPRSRKRTSTSVDEIEVKVEDEFILESIRAKRTNPKTGDVEYFIKWKGFPSDDNTWQSVADLTPQYTGIIEAYEKKLVEGSSPGPSTSSRNASPSPSPRGSTPSPSPSPSKEKDNKPRSTSTSRAAALFQAPAFALSPKLKPKAVASPLKPQSKPKSQKPESLYELYGYKEHSYCCRLINGTSESSPSTSKKVNVVHVKREVLHKTNPIGLARSFENCVEWVDPKAVNTITTDELMAQVVIKYTQEMDFTVLESCPIGLVPVRVLALMKLDSQIVYFVEWKQIGAVLPADGGDLHKTYSLVRGDDLKREFAEDIVKYFDTLLLMDDKWSCKCVSKTGENQPTIKFQLKKVLERSNVLDIEMGRHTRGMELNYYLECPIEAKVDKILNVYRHENIPCYVVKWKHESDAVLVRGTAFKAKYPAEIIEFYQVRIRWVRPRAE